MKKIPRDEEESQELSFKDEVCGLCGGKGYIQERKFGPVHTCKVCLEKGRLNQDV